MATTLSTFKSALVYGGARPSLFEFAVTAAPSTVSSSLSGVNLYCNVSEIPPLTLTPIERQYKGRTVKIPGDMTFGDLSTSIINTEKFNVRNEDGESIRNVEIVLDGEPFGKTNKSGRFRKKFHYTKSNVNANFTINK